MCRISKAYIFQLSWNYNNPIPLKRNGDCRKNEDVLCFPCITGSSLGFLKMIGMKAWRCRLTNWFITSFKPFLTWLWLAKWCKLNFVSIQPFNNSFNQHLLSTYYMRSIEPEPLNWKMRKKVLFLTKNSEPSKDASLSSYVLPSYQSGSGVVSNRRLL